MQKILRPLYALIWRRWLTRAWHCYSKGPPYQAKIIRVKGWRTMLVEDRFGKLETVTPCFLWFD